MGRISRGLLIVLLFTIIGCDTGGGESGQYRTVDGRLTINFVSGDEVELTRQGEHLVGKYSKESDGRIRIVLTALGTEQATYLTPRNGNFQDEDGQILYSSSNFAAAAQQYAQDQRVAAARQQLMYAILQGNSVSIGSAIESGATANEAIQTIWGMQTPLILALERGPNDSALSVVKLLLDKGAQINAADADGKTPLILAIDDDNPEMVKLLLDRGANSGIHDRIGASALDYAEGKQGRSLMVRPNAQQIVQILRDTSAHPKLDPVAQIKDLEAKIEGKESAQNMRQIGNALILYTNEHQGKFPADFGTLIANEEIRCETFFIPGSSVVLPHEFFRSIQPQDAPFRTWMKQHADYVYLGNGKSNPVASDVILVYEKPTNNADGINILWGDNHVEFVEMEKARADIQAQSSEAPESRDTSGTSQAALNQTGNETKLKQLQEKLDILNCADNLRQIFQCVCYYANEHGGEYPPKLSTLCATQPLSWSACFCPTSKPHLPAGFGLMTFRDPQLQDWVDKNTDYIYIGAKLRSDSNPNLVVMYDKPTNHNNGVNVLFNDGHIAFVKIDDVRTLIQKQTNDVVGLSRPTTRELPQRATLNVDNFGRTINKDGSVEPDAHPHSQSDTDHLDSESAHTTGTATNSDDSGHVPNNVPSEDETTSLLTRWHKPIALPDKPDHIYTCRQNFANLSVVFRMHEPVDFSYSPTSAPMVAFFSAQPTATDPTPAKIFVFSASVSPNVNLDDLYNSIIFHARQKDSQAKCSNAISTEVAGVKAYLFTIESHKQGSQPMPMRTSVIAIRDGRSLKVDFYTTPESLDRYWDDFRRIIVSMNMHMYTPRMPGNSSP